MMTIEGTFEEEIGIDHLSGHPYFIERKLEKWILKHIRELKRGDKVRFHVVVDIIESDGKRKDSQDS